MNTTLHPLSVGIVLLLALAACNGSDDGAATSTTTTTEPAPDTTTTTSAPSTSIAERTTTTATSAPATTTASTTETAPIGTASTATEPEETAAQQIGHALIEAREAYLYAVYNLDAPDALDRLEETHAAASPSLDLALENVQTLVDNGWLARPNVAIPDTITIETEPVMVDETTAEVVACVVGAGEVYEPGGAADGSDLIVNGDIEAALNRVTMVLEDGRWKLREGLNLNTEEGTACVVE